MRMSYLDIEAAERRKAPCGTCDAVRSWLWDWIVGAASIAFCFGVLALAVAALVGIFLLDAVAPNALFALFIYGTLATIVGVLMYDNRVRR